jgi:hypothetical protein
MFERLKTRGGTRVAGWRQRRAGRRVLRAERRARKHDYQGAAQGARDYTASKGDVGRG